MTDLELTAWEKTAAGQMLESALQSNILDLATRLQWMSYHTHDSRRSQPGWPDLAMVRRGRLIIAELKQERGRPTAKQAEWLAALRLVPNVEVYLWRPSDWFADRIRQVLL